MMRLIITTANHITLQQVQMMINDSGNADNWPSLRWMVRNVPASESNGR